MTNNTPSPESESESVVAGTCGRHCRNRFRLPTDLLRVLGFDPRRAPTPTDLLDLTYVEDRRSLEQALRAAIHHGTPFALDVRVQPPAGCLRYLRIITEPSHGNSGGPDGIEGSIRDVTDERLAQRRIAMRLSASRVLAEWTTLEASGPALLEVVGRRLGCEVATLWLPDRDVLRPRMSWMAPRLAGSNFERVTNGLRLPRSVGLVGWAWELGKPVTPDTVPAERGFVRGEVARGEGLQTAIAFPAMAGDRVVAVIDLHTPEALELAEQSHQTLMGLGYEVGRVLAARLGQLEGNPLTPRETDILMLAAGGLSVPRIAELAGIERSTVKTHLDHIYAKLAVSNRAAAVAHALRKGLID